MDGMNFKHMPNYVLQVKLSWRLFSWVDIQCADEWVTETRCVECWSHQMKITLLCSTEITSLCWNVVKIKFVYRQCQRWTIASSGLTTVNSMSAWLSGAVNNTCMCNIQFCVCTVAIYCFDDWWLIYNDWFRDLQWERLYSEVHYKALLPMCIVCGKM